MSCANAVYETKGTTLTTTGVIVAPYNLQRKGLTLSAVGGDAQIAVGTAPAALDYFTIKDGNTFNYDSIVPIADVWAKGTGTVVVGEAK